MTGPFFTKQRYLWQPDAWRLLRERACAEYARKAVPSFVAGVHIRFPETRVGLGPRVTVTTSVLEGQSLLAMLYDPAQQSLALDMGLAALEAWQRAGIAGHPFPVFSLIFRLVKGPRALFLARRRPAPLASDQRRELARLVARYMRGETGGRCLVHGDLHASHLLVDLPQSSLGFLDLEAMHTGKVATNFAQLWVGFHYAAPELGRALYRSYRLRFPAVMTAQFDNDVRTELAIRCLAHIRSGLRTGNHELATLASALLAAVLAGTTFETLCLENTTQ